MQTKIPARIHLPNTQTAIYIYKFVTLYRRQGSRPSPRKRNVKKAKWLSEASLQIAVRRREARSKGEKERYKHLNAEFQRIARRDKKAFLSDQCKEIEENSRMGKTRDLFKKIRDTKGTFHAKMGSIGLQGPCDRSLKSEVPCGSCLNWR